MVAFYALVNSHAPSITNQPASASAIVGQNSTFKVAADGNGTLDYQWRLNATNLTSATNAALTVNNASGADAGDYTVAISDSFGSVTSAVAVLTVIIPPAISSSKISADRGSFTLAGTGSANQSYVLLTATNLVPPVIWQSAATNNTDSNGVFNFIDPQMINHSQRFYRVSTP
jgi:Immunoglobulin I-set domain